MRHTLRIHVKRISFINGYRTQTIYIDSRYPQFLGLHHKERHDEALKAPVQVHSYISRFYVSVEY